MEAVLMVLIVSLVGVSSTYVQASNTTDASESNTTQSITATPDTNMSFTFIARSNGTAAPVAGLATPPPRFNVTVFENIYQEYEEHFMAYHNLLEIGEERQCSLRNMLEETLLDFDAAENGRYCGSLFDTILCWPASEPGIINRSCPAVLNDVHYDTSYNVTRVCNPDGTWANKSNYSSCTAKYIPDVNSNDIALQVLVYVGYSLSFTALVGAFCIFLFFKSLRCVRNYIHWNLVSSFVVLYISYFTLSGTIGLVNDKSDVQWICRLLYVLMLYAMMTNFFWMFVEGIYLYTLVVRALTVRRNFFWIYCIFGWAGPVPFVVAFTIVKIVSQSDQCWVNTGPEQDPHNYIIMSPIFLVIAVNLYFLIHIMAILVTKLRASHSLETQQYRKGVKGTLFLLPLLGVTYLLFLLGPAQVSEKESNTASFYIYSYFSTLLSSLQGFFVAVIYVFLNQEVQNVIKRKIRRWREENTLPTRVVSRRGSNTRTSFGNLGIFGGRRSGHGGPGSASEHVTAFKLPGGHISSPEVYSNGAKVPPFIRMDEVQPLTPVSEAPTSPQTMQSYVSLGNGHESETQPINDVELDALKGDNARCNGLNESSDWDCNELPLLSVNACGTTSEVNGTQDSSHHGTWDLGPHGNFSNVTEKKALQTDHDNNGVLGGNHNNNNSLAPGLARPKTASGRSRVTFADELVHENHKRPACCDTGRNEEAYDRSPRKKADAEKPPSRGQTDGEDSPDSVTGKQDIQRSPLLPCIRKKPWASSKPNGTIAFPKAPEGTPV
ncbi:corticotropin-releasing factor receptor 2-like isoform X2 [Acanthaster planci]|uniref:Corticotropin-releasing factor receptor 2-like isoform X2 n=1 Tax=Acanthaster planci TaxID=133434 RepID=A0A8B7XQU8_ACAPL|nr:corticotropin-releasing factor receptor 2-like isoform X2 [Acanthaster planci]